MYPRNPMLTLGLILSLTLSALFGTSSTLMAQTNEAQQELERKKYEALIQQLRVQNQKLQKELLVAQEESRAVSQKLAAVMKLIKGKNDRPLLKLRKENDVLRQKLQALAAENAVLVKRTESLTDALRDAIIKLAKAQVANPRPRVPGGKGPLLEGKVTKVSKDMVQINLGKDQGLTKKSVLMVIRLGKQPKYLGQIEIIAVRATVAIGRRVPDPRIKSAPGFQVGDKVTNSLIPKKK